MQSNEANILGLFSKGEIKRNKIKLKMEKRGKINKNNHIRK